MFLYPRPTNWTGRNLPEPRHPGVLMGLRKHPQIAATLVSPRALTRHARCYRQPRHDPAASDRCRHAGHDRQPPRRGPSPAPAVTVIGEVAKLREKLTWF